MTYLISSKAISKRLVQTRLVTSKPAVIPANGLISIPSLRANPIARPQLQKNFGRSTIARRFHPSPITMASSSALKQTLTPTLLDDVHKLWFDHLSCEEALLLPEWSEMGKWFSRDEAFDEACVTKFGPALEKIAGSGASATQILSAFSPSSPMDWLSIIILLDQVPRNCYRGAESKLVFGCFDPLAEEIALRAIEEGIPTQSPYFKYRMAYRTWFHMPLMHSENLGVHEQAVKVHEGTARDVNELLAGDVSTLTEEERKCHEVLSKKAEALQAFLSNTLDFEKRHKVIIERFGRYPHRNQALGRVSTPEEIEYLNNGGETFG
ncbi:hypothetical protein N7517_005884 [Penicillium concentricum]|uniref:DUF924-domain-containing protein n=1 Tax=Penicillium concentricum TaxID=293559 RepID=A0A9W9S8F3_9EURO|nr:uncharacterized protein N7517_005884 [Penicillium concentricum]KAJ5373878.1 hypothetical protein N7517_005884 [Penicillium concentricum]